jgi:hypothetical protein
VNDALDCFEWKGRGSAGAGRAAVSFGPAMASSIPCDKIEEEGSAWFAMSRLRGWRRKVGEWLTGGGEFGRASLQMGGDPTTNCVGSRRFLRERRKGDDRGRLGAFIGGLNLQEGLGFGSGARRWTVEDDPVQEEESLPKVGDDMWIPGVSGWGRRPRNDLAERGLGPWAVSGTGPNGSPRAFSIF